MQSKLLSSRYMIFLTPLVIALGLSGCSDDGYGGKEYGQEFEKPANFPAAEAETGTPVPPDTGDDLDPRQRD
jgi:hypothetical protein